MNTRMPTDIETVHLFRFEKTPQMFAPQGRLRELSQIHAVPVLQPAIFVDIHAGPKELRTALEAVHGQKNKRHHGATWPGIRDLRDRNRGKSMEIWG